MFTKAYESVAEARRGIGSWINCFYNDERKHQSLGYKTPREIFDQTRACAYMDNTSVLPTSTQAQQPKEKDLNDETKVLDSKYKLLAA